MTLKDIALFALFLLFISTQDITQYPSIGKICPKCCEYHTINAFGSASIQAIPDQAILQASISQNGATVAQAISNLTAAVNSIIAVLTNNGLTSDDYFSTSFNVYPNTSFVNGTSIVIGQIAQESFQITIPSINSNGSNIGHLIDSLATINGIIISGLSFDIKNKTQIYQIAREAAFFDAQQKAIDYTQALNLTVCELLTLIDTFSNAPVVTPQQNKFMANTPTQVNVGAITIYYSLQAIFRFK